MVATTKINIVLMFVYDKCGLGGVLVACEECYNFGLIDRSVVAVLSHSPPPPFYFVFETSNLLTYIQKILGMISLAL